jgi:hypothetical protein
MIVPLGYFLLAWAILLAIYGILVFITLIQTLKHGIASPFTYVSTFVFVAVIALVIGTCGIYFANTDWTAEMNIIPSSLSSLVGGQHGVMKELQLD